MSESVIFVISLFVYLYPEFTNRNQGNHFVKENLHLDSSEDEDIPHSTSLEEDLMKRLVKNYLKMDLRAAQEICNQTIYKMNDSGMGRNFDRFIYLKMLFHSF